ncbi:single-stranded-DNA-specific exonuclease RecJ [uncultured Bilophila sp.]|uniref:single-stranded-DNA-specific exonuclease RecJ n=1 Tax=uncultured Bilophila sp. TaxID=529385 RepID=UPI0026DB3E6E|nr:single-stranded-DNA-specific exonuclease RecJ [uncultured Bilophila sp.]
MKIWKFRNGSEAGGCPPGWAEKLGVPQVVADLLWQRGLDSPARMDTFLSPGLRHLATPDCWPGMREAVDTLEQGIREGRRVLIWGDYDVDGITGATLMLQTMRFHEVPASVHLPDRRTEGYGLNIPELERLAAEEGSGILLTVDCGISDVKAVERAKELGFTVVVSDHHMPPAELPPAHAITNPRLSEDNPCPHLAGVGVAFFLMAALNSRLGETSGKRMDMRRVLDLVALGTLADMVSLTGQNRILVKNGLLKIAEAKRPGLAELKGASGFSPVAALGAGQVVFNLAPRINAAGRLGSPTLAHDMLLTDSHDEAARLAQTLTSLNDERRAEEERIYKEALEQAEAAGNRLGFVLYGKDWHQGVIGIVASRIVETYYRPVLILCADGDTLKGSGRSVPEFDLHAGLTRCADVLLGFGGHRQAAGLRMAPERLEELRDRFDAVIREDLGDKPLTPSLRVDAEMPFSQASDFTVLKGLELLQPFGIGNPEPVFASQPLRVKKRKAFGHSREHISLEVTEESSGITLQAKAWRQADQIPDAIQGKRIRLAYTPGINAYNGIASVELRVRDWEILG